MFFLFFHLAYRKLWCFFYTKSDLFWHQSLRSNMMASFESLVLLFLQRRRHCGWKGYCRLTLLQDPSLPRSLFFFFSMCLVLQWTSPSLPLCFPSPILLLTPPPAMEMNSVLWIWGWRWGLQQISSPACKTASWPAAHILQVLSSQPEFLSAITWPWIPRQRNVHAFFF